jgi:hypothetical protein
MELYQISYPNTRTKPSSAASPSPAPHSNEDPPINAAPGQAQPQTSNVSARRGPNTIAKGAHLAAETSRASTVLELVA